MEFCMRGRTAKNPSEQSAEAWRLLVIVKAINPFQEELDLNRTATRLGAEDITTLMILGFSRPRASRRAASSGRGVILLEKVFIREHRPSSCRRKSMFLPAE
jgi:hypothetical protein